MKNDILEFTKIEEVPLWEVTLQTINQSWIYFIVMLFSNLHTAKLICTKSCLICLLKLSNKVIFKGRTIALKMSLINWPLILLFHGCFLLVPLQSLSLPVSIWTSKVDMLTHAHSLSGKDLWSSLPGPPVLLQLAKMKRTAVLPAEQWKQPMHVE